MKPCLFFLTLIFTTAASAQKCPTISASTSGFEVSAGTPASFSANVSGGDPQVIPTFNWSISNGTIESGQGTASIIVNTTGLTGTITATIDVGGYARECSSSNSVTISITAPNPLDGAPITINSSEFTAPAMKSIVQEFMLANDWKTISPTPLAIVYLYPGKDWKPAQISRTRIMLAKAFLQNSISNKNYKVVTAPAKAEAIYTISLVRNGEAEPAPEK